MGWQNVGTALLWAAALTLISCSGNAPDSLPEPAQGQSLRTARQEVKSSNKVLILGSSVNGGINSFEYQTVKAIKPTWAVDIVTPAQWKALTATQFMSYRAIIIGDASCQTGTAAFQAAIDNRTTWGAVVDGNVTLIGADSASNQTPLVVENAIRFTMNTLQGRTGMYISLGCAYKDAPAGTSVPLLDQFGGDFKVQGVSFCADSAHMFQMYPEDISNNIWPDDYLLASGINGCSARSVFTSYPDRNFAFAAIAMNLNGPQPIPGQQQLIDFSVEEGVETPFVGTPFILVRGAMAIGAGCGRPEQQSGEECDLLETGNGNPAADGSPPETTCSFTCHNNWCGDGVVDTNFGEQCDNGQLNGRSLDSSGTIGPCTAFCLNTNISNPNHTPVALCKNVTVVATNTCGVAASVDNGSYDEDNDLVGCVPNIAGPYPIGDTLVTLTCTDAKGNSSTCAAPGKVTVTDKVLPTVTLVGSANQSVECGSSYSDPGVTANDLCDGPLAQSSVTKTGSVLTSTPSTYNLTYQATDKVGNKSPIVTRAVTVADTLAPSITVNPNSITQECAVPYTDTGVTASDACEGTIASTRIVKSGSVNVAAVGDYQLRYDVSDAAGHPAIQGVRNVFVRDRTKPTVSVVGSSVVVECNGTFTDPGATATDTCSGSLPTSVNASSVNVGVPGNYAISYKATDPSGNIGTSANRAVTVADTLAPMLTLNGLANMPLECATVFTDPGAQANDQCYGNISSSILKTGTVNNMVLGPYTLTYNVKDAKNNAAAAVTRRVTVSDTKGPAITVNGPLSQNVECGSAYADPGASANDACTGVTPAVATLPANPNTPGNYNVFYTATDPSGNTTRSSSARAVTVSDTLPPALTLLGPATSQLECGTPYSDPGYSASDLCAGLLTASVTKTGSVNHQLPGPYALHYTVSDGNNHSVSADRSVTVKDSLAPTVIMTGPSTVALECGAAYTDLGATASDACAGALPTVASGAPNPNVPSTYSITYKATDPSGNTGFSSGSRSVVVSDTLPPTLTLNGNALENLECGTAYVDPSATANDQCAGSLPVTVAGGVNEKIPASYTLTYSANDGQGHPVSTNRTVKVADTLPPTIAVTGALDQTYECGSTYVDPGATATDACDGNLTAAIKTTSSGNTSTPNTLIITYSVKDSAGHETVSPTRRTVRVNDNAPPTLVLLGAGTMNLECANPYTDPGAIANDACFGDVTSRIVRTGTVNTMAPGSYGLTYNVSDPAGQAAPAVSRTVNVTDTAAPVLLLNGPTLQNLECGTPFVDSGATASDACTGDLSASITRTGSVNPNAPADYTLVYNVADSSGNTAPAVTRAVHVQDTQLPSITLTGPAVATYECGGSYTDPGATATDSCAGNLTSAIVATRTPVPNQPANFTITYSVADPSGNQAISSVSRTVTMNDSAPPSIALVGPATQVLECSRTPYMDPGATAIDACVGNVPVTASGTVNMQVAGSYALSYVAQDSAGNSSPTLTRQVQITDTQGPSITLNGSNVVKLECKVDPYMELGATAEDLCSGPVPVSADDSAVNADAPGAYLVHYRATDASNNTSTAVRNVLVEDHLPPTITLNAPNPLQAECGLPFTDPGATASDLCQGASSASVESNTVDSAHEGSYLVRYRAQDSFGNVARASREVKVKDTMGPQLQLNPGPSVLSCDSAPYVDPGATAMDLCSGDLTANITSVSNLDQSRAGQYSITYSVTDAAGHQSTAVRSITVQGTSIHLSDYNLFLLEDYSGGHDVVGKVAAGGNITLSDFAVGSGLQDSDIAKTLVAGGNLTLSRGGVWGEAFYGGTYSADASVTYQRGSATHGTPIDFAARFVQLRSLSSQLASRPATGSTTYASWGGIMLEGSSPSLNVFDVNASAFSTGRLFSISAPAGSLVVVNIRGASASFSGMGTSFGGGIDAHGVLYNFVDTTSLTAQGFGFQGTVLAPYARVNFSNGSWDGGMYAVSLTGNAEGHINPLADRSFCE